MTEQEIIDANEALDHQHEEDAGHGDGLIAADEARLLADAPGSAETFYPDTREGVEWVLCKMADARARAARIRENAEKMAREAERDAEALEWKFGAALRHYADAALAGGRKKSLRFLHGVLGFRTKPESVTITDEAAAVEWAKTFLPSVVVERVDKKELAAVLLSTGEVTDWARLNPSEETFYIK